MTNSYETFKIDNLVKVPRAVIARSPDFHRDKLCDACPHGLSRGGNLDFPTSYERRDCFASLAKTLFETFYECIKIKA